MGQRIVDLASPARGKPIKGAVCELLCVIERCFLLVRKFRECDPDIVCAEVIEKIGVLQEQQCRRIQREPFCNADILGAVIVQTDQVTDRSQLLLCDKMLNQRRQCVCTGVFMILLSVAQIMKPCGDGEYVGVDGRIVRTDGKPQAFCQLRCADAVLKFVARFFPRMAGSTAELCFADGAELWEMLLNSLCHGFVFLFFLDFPYYTTLCAFWQGGVCL